MDLKTTQALAEKAGKSQRAEEIEDWFITFEKILKDIFDDPELVLDFDIESFQFTIIEQDKEPFDFNSLSSGYAAVLNIIADIMLRMEQKSKTFLEFEGIVLIDEIETHLHLDLQKNILPVLTKLFPNIQFVLTTHSPFILNSLSNAVVYDLASHMLVEQGMNQLPYDGIVEGYFKADLLSNELKQKYDRYKQLVGQRILKDEDYAEIARLEVYLDEIPDYLALDFSCEYQKIRNEFHVREN